MGIYSNGIRAIPIPIHGYSHSFPFSFPIVLSIPILSDSHGSEPQWDWESHSHDHLYLRLHPTLSLIWFPHESVFRPDLTVNYDTIPFGIVREFNVD